MKFRGEGASEFTEGNIEDDKREKMVNLKA